MPKPKELTPELARRKSELLEAQRANGRATEAVTAQKNELTVRAYRAKMLPLRKEADELNERFVLFKRANPEPLDQGQPPRLKPRRAQEATR